MGHGERRGRVHGGLRHGFLLAKNPQPGTRNPKRQMKDVNHIIASYDICDARRLQRVAKVMKDFGARVLKSVFECNLTTGQYLEMKHKAEKVIDPLEDSVRFYFICGKCLKNVERIGKGGVFTKDEDVNIV
jgi:CRISPR-associated protein Cas2